MRMPSKVAARAMTSACSHMGRGSRRTTKTSVVVLITNDVRDVKISAPTRSSARIKSLDIWSIFLICRVPFAEECFLPNDSF